MVSIRALNAPLQHMLIVLKQLILRFVEITATTVQTQSVHITGMKR